MISIVAKTGRWMQTSARPFMVRLLLRVGLVVAVPILVALCLLIALGLLVALGLLAGDQGHLGRQAGRVAHDRRARAKTPHDLDLVAARAAELHDVPLLLLLAPLPRRDDGEHAADARER